MPNDQTPAPSAYPVALAFRRYLTTRPDEDLAAATQLTAELAAKNVALAMARNGQQRDEQPAVYYERDASIRGDYSELLISFPDHYTIGFFTAELGEPAWEAELRWLPDEDPPDLIQITRADDGLPAYHEAVRAVIRGVSRYPLLLEEPLEGQPEGRYATWLLQGFPTSQVAYLSSEDWSVEVLSRAQPQPNTGGQ